MKNIFFIALFLFTFNACSNQPKSNLGDNEVNVRPETKAVREVIPSHGGMPDVKKCVCIQLWMPVCGENGKTYSNSCFANCAGVKYKQGSCEKVIKD